MKKKKLLFIGYFSLDKLDSAPKVRTYNLYKNFSTNNEIQTDFITGERNNRKIPLLKYIFTGKIFKVDAIYVEAGARTSTEIDILFFLIAKILNIPMGIYIRDAYPLFNKGKKKKVREHISDFGWFVSIWFYKLTASILFFPTEGLKQLFTGIKKYELIPPAGTKIDYIPFSKNNEKGILYCGAISKLYGVDNLIDALDIVYERYSNIRFYFVCRKNELNDEILKKINNKKWINLMHTDFGEIIKMREKIYLSVVPSSDDPYANINLHIKIFDYMSIGRPIVSTDGKEVSNFFNKNDLGLLCRPTVESIAEKIIYLLENENFAEKLGEKNYSVITNENLWEHRANKILSYLV